MKHDSTFQDGIHASLKALHRMLEVATEAAAEACACIGRREQNLAIGTIIVVEDLLDQAAALYKAVIAMHRCKS